MWEANPYRAVLGDRDVLTALEQTPERIRSIAAKLRPEQFLKSYKPGKWNASQLFQHLAHVESAFGYRVRMALTTDPYVVQPFDQDAWLARDSLVDAIRGFQAFYSMRQWHLPLFRSLTPEEWSRSFHHPERGTMEVGWLVEQLAGHDLHHLVHLEAIAKA